MTQVSYPEQEQNLIYALDIGTRSVIGMLGELEDGRVRVLAVEKQPHSKRAMLDGQIEDIAQVAGVVARVTARLEEQCGRRLSRACVAAAGRALRTESGHALLKNARPEAVTEERMGQLEAAAVSDAEETLRQAGESGQRLFLVGYTVTQYQLDSYPLTNLLGHTGQQLEADVVATFLPSEVIDSLYAVMRGAGLEVASLTLEPIAALNAAIPADLRLLNLALVDIGAGTSDIAVCRDGSVVGYTMATVAGDEITEAIMRSCLVDYPTAERIKAELSGDQPILYSDVLGLEQSTTAQELLPQLESATKNLVEEIAGQITQLNGGAPSALFLAGGGSKLMDLCPRMADALGMDRRRVAAAGAYFKNSAFSQTFDLNDPEYTTPLGIAVSAGLGLISDSYRIQLNGKPAKLFRSGSLTLLELLMMNGYSYEDLLGRSGRNLVLTVDGKRMPFYGEPAVPGQLLCNGKPCGATALAHAGDQITFVPAVSGAEASVTAAALMKKLEAAGLWVNGQRASEDSALMPGDDIRTRAPADQVVTAPVGVTEAAEEPAAEEPVPAPEPAPAAPAPEPAPRRPDSLFQLNGEPLRLPAKEDGQPYYLMDLLDLSGLDFQHLTGPVRLRVNGKPCLFQQVLANGDSVEICYEHMEEAESYE